MKKFYDVRVIEQGMLIFKCDWIDSTMVRKVLKGFRLEYGVKIYNAEDYGKRIECSTNDEYEIDQFLRKN